MLMTKLSTPVLMENLIGTRRSKMTKNLFLTWARNDLLILSPLKRN